MALKSMGQTTVVVDDMEAAIGFFTELGMVLEGQAPVGGDTVDRLCGLEGIQADIAMLATPDGHSRIELTKYKSPAVVPVEPAIAPPNALGLRQIMFEVGDIDGTVARMRSQGTELVGEVVQYESSYRLCYLRGPAGIIVALAEALG